MVVAEDELLAQDRDRSVLKSSPISLAPAAIPPAPELPIFRHRQKHLVRSDDSLAPPPLALPLTLPPLPGRAAADAEAGYDDRSERDWPRARSASQTSSPSSDGVCRRCMLLPQLDCGLALVASLNEATVMPVGGREDAVEDVATDAEPMPLPPPVPLTSVVEWRLASSREPTDSIVGMRLMTPPSIAMGSSGGTSRPNSSIVM